MTLAALHCHAQPRFSDYRQQGDSLMRIHRYDDAISCYEQAERAGARKIFMTSLYADMARCYDAAGRYSDELRCYERLTDLVNDPALMNVKVAEMQLRMGQYQTVADKLGGLPPDPRYEGERLTMLASAYYHTDRQEEALALIDSLIAMEAASKGDTYWTARNNKAFMLAGQGRHQEAAAILREVVSHHADHDPRKYVCLGNLARSEAFLGSQEAIRHIEQAEEGIRGTYGTESHDYLILLRKKAEILQTLGQQEQALEAFKTFFAQEKRYIAANFAFMNEQQRRNYWKREQPLIAECYGMEEADPDFLLDVAAFSKSILHQPNIDRKSSEDFNRAFLTDGQTVRGALRPGECLVEFVCYTKDSTERYGAVVAYSDRPTRFVPLFARSELLNYPVRAASGSKPLSYCIAYTDKTMKNALYADTGLYEKVWAQILDNGNDIQKVYFTPDADLHILAVEYLRAPAARPCFYRLSSSRILTQRAAGRRRGKALVVGSVDYASKTMAPANGYVPDRSGSRQMSEDHTLPREQSGFAYLKGSKTEADTIARLLPHESVAHIEGSDATEQQLKSMLAGTTWLHISTHGFCTEALEPRPSEADKDSLWEDKSLLRCGIILAGANRYAQQHPDYSNYEDGILTSREISALDLSNVDLAVMSACQTALGRSTESGMSGLPQGLKKAGVRTVVASLWHVDDAATAELMPRFYSHLNDADQPCPQDAMRRAQDELRDITVRTTSEGYAFDPSTLGRRKTTRTKVTHYADPFYWAPFIVIDGI